MQLIITLRIKSKEKARILLKLLSAAKKKYKYIINNITS